MNSDAMLASAAGVGLAGATFGINNDLAMASLGGCCFLLAVSATIPLQSRFFFAIGSCILGYLSGFLVLHMADYSIFGGVTAFAVSALGSTVFGSLHKWVNGGGTPRWIVFLSKLLPFKWKRGDSDE